jgi:hypothetical protein
MLDEQVENLVRLFPLVLQNCRLYIRSNTVHSYLSLSEIEGSGYFKTPSGPGPIKNKEILLFSFTLATLLNLASLSGK